MLTATKMKFVEGYKGALNAATGSIVDANANVTRKDIAVLETELWKPEMIKLNRALVAKKMAEMGLEKTKDEYFKALGNHVFYAHDETSLKPYCASVSLYPFLLNGTKDLGGTSKAPKNLRSFCGTFCNLVYQLASGFAGAIATVEFLMYFDYFAQQTYGKDYLKTNTHDIEQELQGVVYTLNQPAAARGNQSVFWNISIFDKGYFEALFGTFHFPDGSSPEWASLKDLQAFFLEWFRVERTKELLTFPVLTASYLVDKETREVLDGGFKHLLAHEMSLGLSFFHYESDSADSLSSCCRLRNALADNTFSYSLGAGGVSTGSFQVVTLNLNRIANLVYTREDFMTDVVKYVKVAQEALTAYRAVIDDYIKAGMLPAYDALFIHLSKQFGTIGINGALEAYETLYGIFDAPVGDAYEDYKEFLKELLGTIKDLNVEAHKKYGFRFNTEFVPAENLGVKNAKWDQEAGYDVTRDCYNSYFFPVENSSWDVLDRMAIHGKEISQFLDGGAACHINLEAVPDEDQCNKLIDAAARLGVPYWTTNVLTTMCKSCGYIDPVTRLKCSKCGSDDVEYATRIIGYLKPISTFSAARQKEAGLRYYDRKGV